MTSIGLMGDGFDPIHLGHLEAAARARDELDLDEVLFLIGGGARHASDAAPLQDREAMLRLAVQPHHGFALSPVPCAPDGDVFSPDILRALASAYGDAALWHIVDADGLRRLALRKDIKELSGLCGFLYLSRGDASLKRQPLKELRDLGARVKCARLRGADETSARVRDALSRGKSAKRFLPDAVYAYIARNHLYGPKPEHILPGMMDAKRWKHTLGVVDTAVRLAETYGVDPNKARLAALLHDGAKCMSFGDMLALCDRNHVELSDLERSRRALLHGPAGMCLAIETFHVTDPDVLNAVRYHTTGRAGMSPLELILYLADAIEPTRREYPGLTQIRAVAARDLKNAALMCMERSVEYVRDQSAQLAPATADAISWLGGQIIRDRHEIESGARAGDLQPI